MGVAEARAGRNWFSARLRLRLATGYGDRGYEIASGHPEFLSPDPLGHTASMSLYDYCDGDPVNGLDPSGTKTVSFTVQTYISTPTAIAPIALINTTLDHSSYPSAQVFENATSIFNYQESSYGPVALILNQTDLLPTYAPPQRCGS
jgi:RHS repeat-associated protein